MMLMAFMAVHSALAITIGPDHKTQENANSAGLRSGGVPKTRSFLVPAVAGLFLLSGSPGADAAAQASDAWTPPASWAKCNKSGKQYFFPWGGGDIHFEQCCAHHRYYLKFEISNNVITFC